MVLFSAAPPAAGQAAEAGAETVITVSNDSYVLFEEDENGVINSTGCAFYVPVDTTLTVGGSGIMTFREYTALGNGGRSGGKLVLNSGTLYCLEFLGNVPGNVNTEVRYYARQCYGGRIADAFSKVTLTANPAEGCVFT